MLTAGRELIASHLSGHAKPRTPPVLPETANAAEKLVYRK